MDDRELAARAARGDPDAFAALVAAYQALAFRAAYYTLGNAAEAEEAVQEALLKAHAVLGRFRPGAPFRPWLLRIVATTALNRARTNARRANLTARGGAGPGRRRAFARGGAAGGRRRRRGAGGAQPPRARRPAGADATLLPRLPHRRTGGYLRLL